MRRFDYDDNDNEEYREEVDNFFEDEGADMTPEEYKMLMEDELAVQEVQMEIVNRELNYRLLKAAIKVCEKSFFWRFKSVMSKMLMIEEVYMHLKVLEQED